MYYLAALNRTTVDLISLDLQGSEMQVLKTLSFDKVKVRVFIVEYASSVVFDLELEKFFVQRGY
ncbi:UNVERIFIED_CONTAM: hypothetical protein GTU68_019452, partial [Idotea baltica]|nr:hypothetical protein [Idotea baltica]